MYEELNVFGIYVAPIVLMILLAWIVALPIHVISDRYGLTKRVWHRGVFYLSVYISVLSIIIIIFGAI